ncbi:gluconate permease, partial [Bacillus cereus]|uniref:GntT/GntP/DsdX family permease n=1 Tax=Bacillus cereus TaxID=1396 RepID=UPI00284ED508|nr:gluconate permease [Bacillus cereus]
VLSYSLILALPAAIIEGPIFSKLVDKRVIPENDPELIRVTTVSTELPSRKVSFFIILLPVVVMIVSVVAPSIS